MAEQSLALMQNLGGRQSPSFRKAKHLGSHIWCTLVGIQKSIPKIASIVRKLATSTGNWKASPTKAISTVESLQTSRGVPSTPTNVGPVQGCSVCPSLCSVASHPEG